MIVVMVFATYSLYNSIARSKYMIKGKEPRTPNP